MLTATDVTDRDTAAKTLTWLFEEYQQPIFAYLVRLVGDRQWAEELAQETFVAALRARTRLDRVENPRAWLYRIATNTALNALKRRKRFAWLPWSRADDLRWEGHDPAKGAGERDAVTRSLAMLKPHYRAPLLLFTHYGLSVAEVAQALNLSDGAVKTRLYRAREMFRQAYEREVCHDEAR